MENFGKGYTQDTMYEVVIVMIILIILQRIIITHITVEKAFLVTINFTNIFFILISQKVLRVFTSLFSLWWGTDYVKTIMREYEHKFSEDFKPSLPLHNIFITKTV